MAKVKAHFKDFKLANHHKVEFEMVQIHQSGTVGFASALIQFQAISSEGAVLRSMKNRITLGFSKFEDGWKVTHQHLSAELVPRDSLQF